MLFTYIFREKQAFVPMSQSAARKGLMPANFSP